MTAGEQVRYGEGVLGGVSDTERQRLAAMGDVNDPATQALLRQLGLRPGWRCREVGAGGGTVSSWIAGEVGRVAGLTLATDIDTAALERLAAQGVRVLRHDVVRDPLPEEKFDLIHARFVLEHLPEREDVLDQLVTALAPGGVIAVECIAEFPD